MQRARDVVAGRWWAQALVVVLVLQGFRIGRASLEGSASTAFANALDVIELERSLRVLHEHTMQGWILGSELVVRFWNVFYGLAHDAVGYLALIALWRRSRPRYRFWRNVAGWMLALGLVGFAVYPITPPRLMPPRYEFVDTGVESGGVGPVQGATPSGGGNRFAAMPSLHVGRATWALFALFPVLRRRWSRGLLVAYPAVMTFATVVTANHWLIDAVGGVLTFGAALALEKARTRFLSPSAAPREDRSPGPG